jgi:hypothetical protein
VTQSAKSYTDNPDLCGYSEQLPVGSHLISRIEQRLFAPEITIYIDMNLCAL